MTRVAAPPATLVDLLLRRARQDGEALAYRFLVDGEVDGASEELSSAALEQRARAIGALLQAEGGSGERALLLYPPGLDFIAAFFGCLFSGAVAVPAYPPDPGRLERTLPRLRAIVKDSGARFVLTTGLVRGLAQALFEQAPELAALRWLATDAAAGELGSAWRPPALSGETIAFLQYTSGSTSAPRGVMVSHQNLLHNMSLIERAAEVSPQSRLVTWLPQYHDMGLITGLLMPLYTGFPVTALSPMAFLQRPLRWLRTIAATRATHSGGPNFAYELCARRISDEEKQGLDLSSWETAYNGAEPIRPETLSRFAQAFAACGFRAEAFLPCYGLAEVTVGTAWAARGRRPRLSELRASALREGRAEPSSDPADHTAIVSCGRSPDPAQEIAIVDPESLVRCPNGVVGEIWLRGPSVAQGYFGLPEESAQTFQARPAGSTPDEGPFLRTGDLGFLHDGELYVTGRRKDLIILRGKNHYPQDLERSVERAHASVRPGCVAAFALEQEGPEGHEGLGVAAEVDVRRGAIDAKEVVAAIRRTLGEEHEVQPRLVALLSAGALPKTSSGKLQRGATREGLLAGSLALVAQPWRAPAEGEWVPKQPAALASSHAASPYVGLWARAEKLERRKTKYRFDLETDVAWDQIAAPGDYFSPAYLEENGVQVAALRAIPGAYALFQWAFAVTICEQFISLEEALLRFTRGERQLLGPLRSVTLLEEEEEKHIALFRRYADALQAQEPAFADELADHRTRCGRFLASIEDRALYHSDAAYHYASWLHTLFFEEFTVYLYDRLAAEPAGLQPAWLSAHAAHRREEIQHVLTDAVHLEAISASEEERYQWSKQVFNHLARSYNALFGWETALHLCTRRYPQAKAAAKKEHPGEPRFLALLKEPAFARTRATAPYLAFLAAGPAPERPTVAASGAAAARLRAWLLDWLSARLGVAPGEIDPARPLIHYGLDSISAITLSGDLETRLGIRLSPALAYEHPTVERLGAHLLSLLGGTLPASPGARQERGGPLPLSARQARLWHLERAHPGTLLDHLTAVYELPERLAEEVHREVLRGLLSRHEALRAAFFERDGRLEQRIKPEPELPLPLSCVSAASPEEWTAALTGAAAAQDRVPFDLSSAPLLRASLLEWEGRQALILTVHHAVTDGWSMEIIAEELAASYHAVRLGRGAPVLPPLRLQPPDVAAAEARFLDSEEAARRLRFWRERIGPRLAEARALAWEFEGASATRALLAPLVSALEALSARQGVSLYITLLTAFHLVQRRRTGEHDLLVNTHLFNRPSEEERALVGYFVNLLTLRTSLPEGLDFAGALARVYASWREALAHALPIAYLVRELRPDLYTSRYMPSPVAFNLLSLPRHDLRRAAPLLRRRTLLPDPSFLFFEEMLLADPHPPGGGLSFTLWYNRLTIPREAAEDSLTMLCQLLGKLAS